jgi:hypothetical protein
MGTSQALLYAKEMRFLHPDVMPDLMDISTAFG